MGESTLWRQTWRHPRRLHSEGDFQGLQRRPGVSDCVSPPTDNLRFPRRGRHRRQRLLTYWTCPCGVTIALDEDHLDTLAPSMSGLADMLGGWIVEWLPDEILSGAESAVEAHEAECERAA